MIMTIAFPARQRESAVTGIDVPRDGEWVQGVAIRGPAVGATLI
jgi:hypothetical protein